MVGDLTAEALEALATTAAQVVLTRGVATIECSDEKMRRDVEQALQQNGVAIERVEIQTQSLEEIFFAAIG